MRVHIDQSPRARYRRVVRRALVQSNAHKTPQRQRVRQPPGNAALRPHALEIPDQQRAKVDPRRQRRPSVLRRIELRTPLLDKLVKALGFQQLIQLLVEGMPRRGCQLPVRDPQSLLLLPLLARAHRHTPILRTELVDTSHFLRRYPDLHHRLLSALSMAMRCGALANCFWFLPSIAVNTRIYCPWRTSMARSSATQQASGRTCIHTTEPTSPWPMSPRC